MVEHLTSDRRGEGFAFFRWALTGIPIRRCIPPTMGWHCYLCRREWNLLQGKNHD